MKITLHRLNPGNYITENGNFRICHANCWWFALDMRTETVIAKRDTYAAAKQALTEYVTREQYRRKNGFWARVRDYVEGGDL